MLVIVGVVIGAAMLVLDIWWGLAVAVVAAFVWGAVIARPWCVRSAPDRAE